MPSSSKKYCPNCYNEILADEMNPVSDIAKCDECGHILSISGLLTEKPKQTNLYEVPEGSIFQIKQGLDRSLELLYPPGGLHWIHFILIPFVVFWLGFVVFWALMASRINYFVPLFSLPFLYVGWSMAKGLVRGIFGWESLKISRKELTHAKGMFSKSKKRIIPFSEIQGFQRVFRDQKKVSPGDAFLHVKNSFKNNNKNPDRQPAILIAEEEIFFFESATKEEQRWILALMNDIYLKLK